MFRLFFGATLLALTPLCLSAQGRGAAPAVAARASAPWDITGYWVALITDDWRYRMLTPPKGNIDYVPVTADARRATDAWDPARDQAAGEQCKGYGAGGIMRLPGRLHITWADDNTLVMEIDTGAQTRRFNFQGGPAVAPAPTAAPSWQGYSNAQWELPGGAGRGGARGAAPAATPGTNRPGQLRVVTTRLRPGYVRKNGIPYSANATITENFVRLVDNGGQEYLAVTTTVDDPANFQPPYIKTYEFKKQVDARGWNPRPCSAG